MKIRSESTIQHPRTAVFEAYRDHLSEIAAFLPDIEDIHVLNRTEVESHTHLHNEWISNADIPAVARSFLQPEHLRWDDHAVWNPTEFVVEWRLETRVFQEAFSCHGSNRFLEEGPSSTRVVVEGDLTLDLRELPGVPSFVAKRLAPQVEGFIVKMITPNLEEVNRAVGRYLESRAGT